MEWRRVHESVARHDHTRDPEEKNLRRGDQIVGGIEGGERSRALVRPAQGGDRKEPRGKPGVEHILVLANRAGALVALRHIGATHDLVFTLVAVPDGNAMAPPKLPGDVPVADVLQPVDVYSFSPL